MIQILQNGGTEPPTRPKGRPKKYDEGEANVAPGDARQLVDVISTSDDSNTNISMCSTSDSEVDMDTNDESVNI